MSIPRSIIVPVVALAWLTAGCFVAVDPLPSQTCVPGATFQAADGCNTCTCPNSGLVSEAPCTDMACIYNPCQDKTCGDDCNPCDPADKDCVAPGAIMACNDAGQCVASGPDLCEEPYDPCEGKICGDDCNPCDPADEDCMAPGAIMACNDAGQCVASGPDLCEEPYDPCLDKTCGDDCNPCDPADKDCIAPGAVMACDTAGQCVAASPDLCEGDLCADVVCPGGTPGTCEANVAYGPTTGAECDPETGECVMTTGTQQVTDCTAEGLVCVDGECVEKGDLCADVACPSKPGYCEGTIAHAPSNGGVCNPDTGECEGAPSLAPPQDCALDGLICVNGECVEDGKICGGFAGLECDEGQICDIQGCGTDLQGLCVDMVDGCDANYDPVCGCDGETYGNDCERLQFGGVSLDHEGACKAPSCEPMNAAGEGPCDLELGWLWNAEACISISGCNCEGEDCDALFSGLAECEEAHAECVKPYDPCAKKSCGDACTLCAPDDKDCVETEEVKTCNAQGVCVGGGPGFCDDNVDIKIFSCGDNEIPSDPFSIDAASIEADTLFLTVTYSGGCEDHEFLACFDEFANFKQVSVTVGHDANNDPCDGVESKQLAIDLILIQEDFLAKTGEPKAELEITVNDMPEPLIYTFP